MHKISVDGDIGNLEWTPPRDLQAKLDSAPPAIRAQAQQWMGRMIEGYLCALLDSQRTANGIAWLEQQTTSLVSDAVLLSSNPTPTAPANRSN